MEFVCQDKLYLCAALLRAGVPVPQTQAVLYSDATGETQKPEARDVDESLDNIARAVSPRESLERGLFYKLRRGTHGHGISRLVSRTQLRRVLRQRLRRTPGNPIGFLFQASIPRAFDYRTVFAWNAEGAIRCVACLVRFALSDETDATNTARGAPSIGVPVEQVSSVVEVGEKAVEAVRERGSPGILGIDVLPALRSDAGRKRVYEDARQLKAHFEEINRIRSAIEASGRGDWSRTMLTTYDRQVAPIFEMVQATPAYDRLVKHSMVASDEAEIYVIDANTCIDYAQNTHYNCHLNFFQECAWAFGLPMAKLGKNQTQTVGQRLSS